MAIPAARVLAFPGIDLETLSKLRALASDAFVRDDLAAYQDACITIRKLIGGLDASETGARSYHITKWASRKDRRSARSDER
jgi:hypothetical protein